MINKFANFVREINLDNSKLYKLDILSAYKNDEDIKYILNFIYNPYIVTGISKKKINRNVGLDAYLLYGEDVLCDIKTLKDIFEYIKIHNTGSDEDILKVQLARYFFCKDNEELFDLIITKNIQLGVDVKSINKAIPGLIPEFNVQLANKYFDNPSIVEGKEFALTNKIDGSRIIALKENGQVSFYSRQGQKYEGLIDLENEMAKMLPDNICLDGELTLLNPGNLASKDQYKQTMKISRKDGEKHDLKMLVFDCMTAEEFRNQSCDIPYITRRNSLFEAFSQNLSDFKICTKVAIGCEPCDYFNSIIEELNKRYTYFQILPYLYIGNDTNKIMTYLNIQIAKNEEGVMINITDAPYEFKRCNTLLKVKKMQTYDLQVVDMEEGSNSNAGTLGALLVRYRDGNIVKVGSGFSKELRDEIWNNKDQWIGRIIAIQYFEETQNQNGGLSLRFPVYLDYRDDKSIADF